MEDGNIIEIKEVKTLPKELSFENIFTFYIKNLEFYAIVKDPISECFTNFKKIKSILDAKEKKSFFFFFFREKLLVKFYTKKTN